MPDPHRIRLRLGMLTIEAKRHPPPMRGWPPVWRTPFLPGAVFDSRADLERAARAKAAVRQAGALLGTDSARLRGLLRGRAGLSIGDGQTRALWVGSRLQRLKRTRAAVLDWRGDPSAAGRGY